MIPPNRPEERRPPGAPAEREGGGKVRGRSVAFLITAVAATAILGYGIFRKEIVEVLYNGALL